MAITTVPAHRTAVADFESVRSRLFGIAYQMLGRAADAEDVVQDVWVRWQGADQARVRDRVAFLVTITTRLALNAATSARASPGIHPGFHGCIRHPSRTTVAMSLSRVLENQEPVPAVQTT